MFGFRPTIQLTCPLSQDAFLRRCPHPCLHCCPSRRCPRRVCLQIQIPFRMREVDSSSIRRIVKRTTTADEPGATPDGPHPVRGSHISKSQDTDLLPLAGRLCALHVLLRTSFPSQNKHVGPVPCARLVKILAYANRLVCKMNYLDMQAARDLVQRLLRCNGVID